MKIFENGLFIDLMRRVSYPSLMSTPGEELIEELDQLRKKLNELSDRLDRSGVERTAGLGNALGKGCGYYKKSLKKFIDQDYIDLKNLVAQTHKLFEVIG